jgi:Tol biopolymer transport system component
VDARSDIFSFGTLLYEMVTGRRPFGGGSSAEVLAALLKEQPKPPSEVVAEVPKELERIILRCLRKEPARRFQNMLDVKVELEEVKEESDSQAAAPAGAAVAKRRSQRRRIALAAAGLLILGAVAALTLWRPRRPELPRPAVVQLTSERYARGGSFSPDGAQIAYASARDDGDNWDICLKIVGETEVRRLTTDPAREEDPAWSPDGTQIAFLRRTGDVPPTSSIHLVSPLGGPARRVSGFPADGQLSWSVDGRWLAARKVPSEADAPGGIFLVSVASGEARAVTLPKPPAFDVTPAFSPDGQALAYAHCEGPEGSAACDVYVLALDAQLRPQGTARRLTRQGLLIVSGGLAWTGDAHSIVYGGDHFLWRVGADGGAPPERLELAGRLVSRPSAVASRDRLAFTRDTYDPDLFRLQLDGSSTPLLASTLREVFPQYSLRMADGSPSSAGGGSRATRSGWSTPTDRIPRA